MKSYNTKQEVNHQLSKLLGLELVRFISALSVLVWHYQHFFYIANKPTDFIRENQPFYGFLRLFYDHGHYGVQVFWCISGFIFFWKYRDAISSKAVTWRKFFVLRFSRLYPLHLVTLILVLALQFIYFSQRNYFFVYQDNDLYHFALQLFLASNWSYERAASFNGPIWSISVEVLVYLCFFVVLRCVGKSILTSIVILLFCLIAKYFEVSNHVFDCLAFFYAGGLSSIAFLYFESTKYRKLLNIVSLASVLTVPIAAYIADLYKYKYFALLFLISYMPILLFYSAQNFSIPGSIKQVIEAAGNMTYSSYLIHFPIQLIVALCYLWMEQSIPYYSQVFFLGFMASTLVCSYYIYRLFELPAQNNIRNRFGKSNNS